MLDAAGADPYAFSYLEVQRPAGGAVRLSRDQALDPGAFAEGPPDVYATAAGTGFLRPSAGPEDVNASDSFTPPRASRSSSAKARRLRSPPGPRREANRPASRSLQAIVERPAPVSSSPTPGTSTTAPPPPPPTRPTLRQARQLRRGRRRHHASDETGTSAVVTIQVGAPAAGPDRKGGGTDETPAPPTTGPRTAPSGAAGAPRGSQHAGAVVLRRTRRGRRPRVRRGTTDRPQPSAAPPANWSKVNWSVPDRAASPVAHRSKRPAAANSGERRR